MTDQQQFQENYLDISSRQRMFYRCCIPDNPKGAVCVVHGYTEHSGRYTDVLEYFRERGFAVVAPDLLGFGKSAKTLGDMKSFRCSVEAVASLLMHLQENHGIGRFFVIGHSLGGCMTLALAGLYPDLVKGLVTVAAMILIPDYVSPMLRIVSNILAAMFPKLPVQKIDLANATRNEAVKAAAKQDQLYYRGKIRARTGVQMLKGMELARSMLQNITAPSLVLHGSKDVIMPQKGSELVLKELACTDKTLKVFDGWYHELLNEPDKEILFKFILKWINEHNR
ncbi:MAG: lysophospholipase [Spirochaetales bacterium]|nr:lysophospholipase [Spirochaetales bacterium]